MEATKTCGDLYQDGLNEFGGTPEAYWAFAAGFVSGQAEKVYNGACPAAMFRPSDDTRDRLREIVLAICERYNLAVTSWNGELWIHHDTTEVEKQFEVLTTLDTNSPEWHLRRGQLCGISNSRLDLQYHKRKNFNKPCDTGASGG